MHTKLERLLSKSLTTLEVMTYYLLVHTGPADSRSADLGSIPAFGVDVFPGRVMLVTDEGSKQEILSRIAQTIGALTQLKTIWKDKNIALSSKIRLMRSLVISIFPYACETWTLTAELEKKILTTEVRCFRRLLGISYRDHVTNEEVGNRIRQAIGPYEDLTTVKKRKLRWYGHKTRSTGLAKMILQGSVQGGRRRGRQKKRWEDNVTEWTGLKLDEAPRKAEIEKSGEQWLPDHPWCPNGSTRLRDK